MVWMQQGCAVDCGRQAGAVAGQVEGGRRRSGALLALIEYQVGKGQGQIGRAAHVSPGHRQHAGTNRASAQRSRGSARKSRTHAGIALRWA